MAVADDWDSELPVDYGEVPAKVVAECLWSVGSNDVFKVDPRRIVAGQSSWEPRAANWDDDRVDFDADKAIRILQGTLPTYFDASLLVLRAVTVKSVVFVFARDQ